MSYYKIEADLDVMCADFGLNLIKRNNIKSFFDRIWLYEVLVDKGYKEADRLSKNTYMDVDVFQCDINHAKKILKYKNYSAREILKFTLYDYAQIYFHEYASAEEKEMYNTFSSSKKNHILSYRKLSQIGISWEDFLFYRTREIERICARATPLMIRFSRRFHISETSSCVNRNYIDFEILTLCKFLSKNGIHFLLEKDQQAQELPF